MLVISTRELTQNQRKIFEIANKQRVIIKRKNRFFQIVDLGEMIPELNDSFISKKKMYAKIDEGIEEYKQGKTKKLDIDNINSFLGI
jgi:hypothetical protein